VTVLVAPPVMLLGAASPYAIRLGVERVEEAGAVAGRLYALSTFGSLVGTFALQKGVQWPKCAKCPKFSWANRHS